MVADIESVVECVPDCAVLEVIEFLVLQAERTKNSPAVRAQAQLWLTKFAANAAANATLNELLQSELELLRAYAVNASHLIHLSVV